MEDIKEFVKLQTNIGKALVYTITIFVSSMLFIISDAKEGSIMQYLLGSLSIATFIAEKIIPSIYYCAQKNIYTTETLEKAYQYEKTTKQIAYVCYSIIALFGCITFTHYVQNLIFSIKSLYQIINEISKHYWLVYK